MTRIAGSFGEMNNPRSDRATVRSAARGVSDRLPSWFAYERSHGSTQRTLYPLPLSPVFGTAVLTSWCSPALPVSLSDWP